MTALREYQRLEATGLWRAAAKDQRREVVVSIGDATLIITDLKDQALAHWSLAAVRRENPDRLPAIYAPDGDPEESLELDGSEAEMIAAIEKLRHAIERSRPRPGRLRTLSFVAVAAAVLAVLLFWLPDALVTHTVRVVPQIKRQEIGGALLARIERVAGRKCTSRETEPVLARLARRTGARRLVVLENGVAHSRYLVGGIVALNKALIEDYEDPAVVAGYILAELARAAQNDPLRELLTESGPIATFRLLTTGELDQQTLDDHAARVLTKQRPEVPDPVLLAAFAKARIASTPYAFARDITGESVLGLIEADPMAGQTPEPVLVDRDWVLLQTICGG